VLSEKENYLAGIQELEEAKQALLVLATSQMWTFMKNWEVAALVR
jgi:hypothetical protein